MTRAPSSASTPGEAAPSCFGTQPTICGFTVAGSYQQTSDNAGLTFENTRVAPDFAAVLPQDPKADRHVSFDSLSGARNEADLISTTVDWKLPWVDVKLIGSDQRLNAGFVQSDFDKSDLPIVNIFSVKQLSKQYTGELQFLSNNTTPFHERFKWVGGLFVIQSSGGFDPIAFDVFANGLSTLGGAGGTAIQNVLDSLLAGTGQNLTNGVRLLNYGVLKSLAYSAYLQGTLTIIDSLELTLGMRLQHEDRDLEELAYDTSKFQRWRCNRPAAAASTDARIEPGFSQSLPAVASVRREHPDLCIRFPRVQEPDLQHCQRDRRLAGRVRGSSRSRLRRSTPTRSA